MCSRTYWAALAALAALLPFTASATTVSTTDLPNAVQTCISDGNCTFDSTSTYNSASVAAFYLVTGASSTTPQFNYLVRYALGDGSAATSTSSTGATQTTPYTGYLWMQVQSSYSATQTADPVTLYLDKVAPVPASYDPNIAQGDPLAFTVSAADLLAGSSQETLNADGTTSGDLSGDTPIACASLGCSEFAQINFDQLQFGSNGTTISAGFNSADSRSLVFTQGTADDGSVSGSPYNNTESFSIKPVPLPQSLWLFASGLACLIFLLGGPPILRRSP